MSHTLALVAAVAGGLSSAPSGGGVIGSTDASNTTLGTAAGDSITSATGSVAVGVNALTGLTSGLDNVGVGKDAGAALVDGNRNTLVGVSAGYSLGNSNDNVMLGYGAGSNAAANTVRNVVIGSGAASNLNGGLNNVLIGHDAGDEIVAGVDSILLGRKAGEGLGDVSNRLAIGSPTAVIDTITIESSLTAGAAVLSKLRFTERLTIKPGTAAPIDGDLANGSFVFWLDEAANKLMVKVKYADGTTIKAGEIALV